MEGNKQTQNFFITDDGYINLRLKVTTDDPIERENLISMIMGNIYRKCDLDFKDNVHVDKIYFQSFEISSILNSIKEGIISDIESVFDKAIGDNADI